MRFEVRYAALTKFLFVAALFSSGVPLLNVVAFVVFASTYALDKCLFSKFYAIPQTMTNALALTFSRAVPYAVFFSVGINHWEDGRPGISSNPSTSLKSNSFSMILEPLILASRVLDN